MGTGGAPLTVLAVDATADADALEALKDSLVEVGVKYLGLHRWSRPPRGD